MLKDYYSKVDKEVKANFTLKNGEFLAFTLNNDSINRLYYLYDYFIDLQYNHKKHRFEKVDIFKETKKLDKYLDKIDLDDV